MGTPDRLVPVLGALQGFESEEMTPSAFKNGVTQKDSASLSEIDILWMTAGLGCDGDTIAVTAATQPSIEDLILGAFPWIPNVKNKQEGYWATFGTDAKTGQPITTCDWIDQLAPKAWAVVAAGTCAA